MKRKIFTFAAALALTVCAIFPVSAAGAERCGLYLCQSSAEQTTASQTSQASMSQIEIAACELVNRYRADNGLSPLTISAELTAKARIKAQDMYTNRYFSHNSPTYGSPFMMMRTLGITYRSAGENIAMNYRTAEAVVSAWINSPSHRANLLSESYTTIGIGYTNGYWAQWLIR